MPPLLGYWDIRGLAQPLRLLMEYAGIQYEEKRYVCGPPPTYDKSCWFNEKFNLGLDFPNLPYLIDGDMKITQSGAIMKYLARKGNLEGMNEGEKVRADMVVGQAADLSNRFTKMCYNPKFETLKEDFDKDLPSHVEAFDKFLGENKWFAGPNLTYADFIMYELLDQLKTYKSDVLESADNLKRFHHQFQQLKAIQQYFQSDKYIESRLNNRIAKFGSGY